MNPKVFKQLSVLSIVLIMLLLAACGGGAPEATEPPVKAEQQEQQSAAEPTKEEQAAQPVEPEKTEEPVKTEEPSASSSSSSGSGINKISDAKKAIIQIESQGSFIDPQFGQVYNAAGRGSGFIIDPSGLAVTNNHVVTGSALLKVWVGGDQSKTYNAKVLGVSECSDLAVIDIEGSGFESLDWFEGPIDVGQDIYVAGFPLGDPEYSLTKGIISKAKANGETSWSSVDSVIEYDATTNPGNSGGPVLTEDARVVGVHYAGNSDTRQAYGISRDIAKPVIDELKSGNNLDSLGINGQAVSNEDGSLTGVWVSSVKSGSPADKAGLEGGDIVNTIEGMILATDGTMSDYCDIVRSHSEGDTLNIEVVRFATGELLEGQLNGEKLAIVGTFDTGNTQADTGGQTDTGGDQSGSESPSGYLNLNASASGDSYYETDFDALLTDWSYFLMSGEEDGFTAEITDSSKLSIEITGTDTWVYFYLNPLVVGDVRLDTSVENLGRNNNNVSLICRYDPERGWYEFNVANNGLYTIFYYDVRGEEYITIFSGGSTAIKTGKSVNEITAICQGNELTLGVNGTLVRTVEDDRLSQGYVGLSLSSFSVTPILAEFDYFVASVP
jgi:S1-C subfamily serine protease